MKDQAMRLGRIRGISIVLHASWFLIFAVVTALLALGYYPSAFPNWLALAYWLMSATTALALFACVLVHELSHAIVAQRYDVPVRKITLFIFGGIAEVSSETPCPVAEFAIALAGSLVSLALAACFWLLPPLVASIGPLHAFVAYLFIINLSLGLFNLIPGYPLDGGRVLRAIIWALSDNLRCATIVVANIGRSVALLLIFLGVLQAAHGSVGNGLWIAFIGWFLLNAARGQLDQQRLKDLLAGHYAGDLRDRGYTVIPAGMSLQQLVDERMLAGGERCFAVEQAGSIFGSLTMLSWLPATSNSGTTRM